MAAQRAAGVAFAGTLKAQVRPSALRPVWPAAKAADVEVMQNTRSAATTISIISLMARVSPNGFPRPTLAPNGRGLQPRESAQSLHKNDARGRTGAAPGFYRGATGVSFRQDLELGTSPWLIHRS